MLRCDVIIQVARHLMAPEIRTPPQFLRHCHAEQSASGIVQQINQAKQLPSSTFGAAHHHDIRI
jgi:hypothetical protein